MGAYRSKPITDKVSSDESGKYVKCGASSMQGWRVTQEDSHNCIMEYDDATSLFAVYDGHGGHEVAQYCSENLPLYLKECASYKKGEYSTALKEAFLGFDATLVESKVVKVLKQIVKSADDENEGSDNQNSGSEDEENILNLYEEAQMPLEEVMAKYQADGLNPLFKKIEGETPLSPYLVAKQSSKLKTSEVACSSKAGSSSSSSTDVVPLEESSCESGEKEEEKSSNGSREKDIEVNDDSCDKSQEQQKTPEELEKKTSDDTRKSNGEKTSHQSGEFTEEKGSEKTREASSEKLPEKSDLGKEKKMDVKVELSVTKANETEENSSEKKSEENLKFDKEMTSEDKTESQDEKKAKDHVEEEKNGIHKKEHKVHDVEKNTSGKKVEMNGDIDPNDLEGKTKKEPHENGDVADEETEEEEEEEKDAVTSLKGKGKAIVKKTERPKRTSARQRNMALLFRSWLSAQEPDSDSDDEGDESFQGAEDSSSNEDDDKEEEAGAEGEEEEEEEADDEEDEDGEEEEEEDDDEPSKWEKGPGVESGCTAVVAILHGRDLYVANAGDSRCIVSRSGEALDMSLDHKPEDSIEFERIVAAGGFVSGDGRVNGGLNLSRAIGDHAYKKTENLPAEEQMITALPDIRTLSLDPDQDEFMVLACDGIWNSMTSQEVISFVRTKLQSGDKKLSTICEELFDFCLAPDTASDGTGCDNMTAVIVQFLPVLKETSSSNLPNTSIPFTTAKRPASPTENSDSTVKRFKTDVV